MSNILISLIGKETIPNYQAYKEFSPDILIHIYSNVTKRSSAIIESMVDQINTEVISIECDGWDYIDLMEKINQRIKLKPNDKLFVNVTGGTKMMALPVYDFAKIAEKDNEVFYFYIDTKSKIHWFLEKNKTSFFKKLLTIEEIITLQDQKIQSSLNFNEALGDFEESLNVIVEDLGKATSKWNKFLKYINKFFRSSDVGSHFSFEEFKKILNSKQDLFLVNKENKNITISYHGEIYLIFPTSEEKFIWFVVNGGWFEILTARKLVKKYPDFEILLNVIFNFKSDDRIAKNEVDILMCDGNKLFFIECKSGNISSKDTDTIKIRKDTYGGLIGKSILVGRYPINQTLKHLLEKVKEYEIQYQIYNYL